MVIIKSSVLCALRPGLSLERISALADPQPCDSESEKQTRLVFVDNLGIIFHISP